MAWPDLTTELEAKVQALTRPGEAYVNPDWVETSIGEAVAAVKLDVLSALAGRGYSPSQIETWSAGIGRPLLLQIGLFYVATDSRLDLRDADGQKVEPPAVLDRRKDLLTMFLTDATGLPLVPLQNVTSPIGHGSMKVGADEIFRTRDQPISGNQQRSRQWRQW